jgi:hypothetical protein
MCFWIETPSRSRGFPYTTGSEAIQLSAGAGRAVRHRPARESRKVPETSDCDWHLRRRTLRVKFNRASPSRCRLAGGDLSPFGPHGGDWPPLRLPDVTQESGPQIFPQKSRIGRASDVVKTAAAAAWLRYSSPSTKSAPDAQSRICFAPLGARIFPVLRAPAPDAWVKSVSRVGEGACRSLVT